MKLLSVITLIPRVIALGSGVLLGQGAVAQTAAPKYIADLALGHR